MLLTSVQCEQGKRACALWTRPWPWGSTHNILLCCPAPCRRGWHRCRSGAPQQGQPRSAVATVNNTGGGSPGSNNHWVFESLGGWQAGTENNMRRKTWVCSASSILDELSDCAVPRSCMRMHEPTTLLIRRIVWNTPASGMCCCSHAPPGARTSAGACTRAAAVTQLLHCNGRAATSCRGPTSDSDRHSLQ